MQRISNMVGTILLIGIMLFIYARFIEPNMIITNRFSIQGTTIAKPFKGVFFSDTHYGMLYRQEKIEELVEKINKESPDIVIFGGDFFDSYKKEQGFINLKYLSEQLGNIEATYCKLAVWGNHDQGGGSAKVFEDLFEAGGFQVLKNENYSISELNVTIRGLDDYLFGVSNYDMSSFNSEQYNILITHAPDVVDDLELESVDFVFAGHSHGGQISMGEVTKRILPYGAQKYIKGKYLFENSRNTQLFVSKGIGSSQLPYRFLNIPEIVSVTFDFD